MRFDPPYLAFDAQCPRQLLHLLQIRGITVATADKAHFRALGRNNRACFQEQGVVLEWDETRHIAYDLFGIADSPLTTNTLAQCFVGIEIGRASCRERV